MHSSSIEKLEFVVVRSFKTCFLSYSWQTFLKRVEAHSNDSQSRLLLSGVFPLLSIATVPLLRKTPPRSTRKSSLSTTGILQVHYFLFNHFTVVHNP